MVGGVEEVCSAPHDRATWAVIAHGNRQIPKRRVGKDVQQQAANIDHGAEQPPVLALPEDGRAVDYALPALGQVQQW